MAGDDLWDLVKPQGGGTATADLWDLVKPPAKKVIPPGFEDVPKRALNSAFGAEPDPNYLRDLQAKSTGSPIGQAAGDLAGYEAGSFGALANRAVNFPIKLANKTLRLAEIGIGTFTGGIPEESPYIPEIPPVAAPHDPMADTLGEGMGMLATGAAAPAALGMSGGSALLPAAAMGATLNGVDMHQKVLQATGNPDKAMVALLDGAGVGAASALPVGRVLSHLNQESGGVLVRALGDLGTGFGVSAAQSSLNDVIQQNATGEDLPILKNALEQGGLGALTVFFAGTLASGAHGQGQTQAEPIHVESTTPAGKPHAATAEAVQNAENATPPVQDATPQEVVAAPPVGVVGVGDAAPGEVAPESKPSAIATPEPLEQAPTSEPNPGGPGSDVSPGDSLEGAAPEPDSGAAPVTPVVHEKTLDSALDDMAARRADLAKQRTPEEMTAYADAQDAEYKDIEKRLLGDKLGEWNKAQRKGDTARVEAIEKERGLSQAQVDSLYGVGDRRAAPDDLRKIAQEVYSIEGFADRPDILVSEAARAIRKLGVLGSDPAEWADREPVAFVRMQTIQRVLAEQGIDPVKFSNDALNEAGRAYSDRFDAADILEPFTKQARKPPPRVELPEHKPATKIPLRLKEAPKPEPLPVEPPAPEPKAKLPVSVKSDESLGIKGGDLLSKVFDVLKQSGHDIKAPASDEPIRTPDEIAQAHEILDRHLGERQVRETEVAVRARKHLAEIKDITEGGIDERSKTRAAMQLYIDSKDAGGVEAARAAHPGFDPESQAGGLPSGVKATKGEIVERAKNLTPAQRALADKIAAESNAEGRTFKAEGLIDNAHENYSTRIWAPEEPKANPSGKVGKFSTSAAQMKARSLDSIFHGWELGKELQTFDATQSQHIASRNLYQVRADKALIAEGVKAGVLSTTKEPGYIEIQHPNAKKYVYAGSGENVETFNKDIHAAGDAILLRQPLYAAPEVARALNAIVGHSRISDIGGKPGEALKAYDKWNRIFKEQILSFSGFHAITFMRAHALGTDLRGINPVKAWSEGGRVLEEFGPIAQRAVRAGLRLQGAPDFDEFASHSQTQLGKALDAIPAAAQVKAAVHKTGKAITDFTFQQLGPRLKMWNYIISEQANLRRGMSADEAAKAAATLTNDRFGGLNNERLGKDKTVQHAKHMLMLAPDWTESNLRQAAKAFQRGDAQAGYRSMWANVLYRGLGATVLANYILSGMDNKKFQDKYKEAWDAGNLRWADIDITPLYKAMGGKDESEKYLSLLGHFTMPTRAIENPVKFLKDRASVLSQTALTALIGTDYASRPFTSLSELTGKDSAGKLKGQTVSHASKESAGPVKLEQIPSFVTNRVKSLAPIPFQNAASFLMGETDGFDTLIRSVGFPEMSVQPSQTFAKYHAQIEDEQTKVKNGKDFDANTAGWKDAANATEKNIRNFRRAGLNDDAEREARRFNDLFRGRK